MYRPDFVGRKRQRRRGSSMNPPTTARASDNHRAPPKPSDNTSCAPRPSRAHSRTHSRTQHIHSGPPSVCTPSLVRMTNVLGATSPLGLSATVSTPRRPRVARLPNELSTSTTSLPSSHTTAVVGVVAAEAAAGRATAPAPEPASDPNPHARAGVSHWNLKTCGH